MNDARAYMQSGANRLISLLAEADAQQVETDSQRVSLKLKQMLIEPNQPIDAVHFPLTGVTSMVLETQEGTVEVATVGNEGLLGIPLVLGADRSPTRGLCQIPGDALRMPSEKFKALMNASAAFHALMQRYAQALVNQISQSVVCNHLHAVEQRMCRWLLMMHDRVAAEEFTLTQEFLSQMLGVRRPSVTVVAGMLQQAGLISYSRGRIKIHNREGLEAGACECYRVVRDEFERLFASARQTAGAK